MSLRVTARQRARIGLGICALLGATFVIGVPASVARATPAHRTTHRAAPRPAAGPGPLKIAHGRDSRHDESPKLRDIPKIREGLQPREESEPNPPIDLKHTDSRDPVVQRAPAVPKMPGPVLNFDGIAFPGVVCNCAPPDTNGEVGLTQYVQTVNEGLQVFSKSTGASVYGPVNIATIWSGFGGVCETNGDGDPVLLYDQLANRWLVSYFAGATAATDECIAISSGSDATGSYYRYDFHLGSNFYDYPHLGVWPDGYYLSENVFDAAGTTYLGPQPFVFDRDHMLNGQAASFISTAAPLGGAASPMLPADLDGSALPPAGAPESFVQFPSSGTYTTYHFHADFGTPANSTWTTFAAPAAAGFSLLCPTSRACVPEPNGDHLDGIGDRLMFRLAYRNFGDHESLVGNYSVSSGAVAGIRWFELRNVSNGPETVYQQSTYQPDTTWRWMGSAAMDASGDLAVGFSVSSPSIAPGLRYAGRLAGDPLNSLAQGEATLFDGGGSQSGSGNRWGDYSDLTIDPVDDCTFWYTNEYYPAGSTAFNWRTRIGSFRFPSCSAAPTMSIAKVADASSATYGSPIGFTVTLTNNTAQTATGLSVSDNLPSGSHVSWSVDGAHSDTGWQVTGTPPNQSVVYTPTQLAANATSQVHVVSGTGANSCGNYPNTASFTTSNLGSGNASAAETVVGTPHVVLTQGWDDVTAPVLPTGWTAANAAGPDPLWVTSASGPDTAPNAAFVDDPGVVSDKALVSPSIAIAHTNARVSFRNSYALETNYDGGVLEISIDGGPFTDIVDAGGSFLAGGYTHPISTQYSNPLAGRSAWTGNSGGYVDTTARLPDSAAGHSIQLRWRMGSDSSAAASGWHVDGVSVADTDCAPPMTVPGAPSVTDSSAGDGAVSVAFAAGPDGGSPITGYTAECVGTDGGASGSQAGSESPIVVGGLSHGKGYHCRVRATNGVGDGPFGEFGSPVVVPAVVPGAPAVTRSVALSTTTARITFTAPADDGGSPITKYTVSCTSRNGGKARSASAAASPVKVRRLTPGAKYRCRVRARNAAGIGPWSASGARFTMPRPRQALRSAAVVQGRTARPVPELL